ncbi:MAG TPA: type II secretion system protein N [Leptolyngbyaceae cyanobacterium]
MSQEVSNNRIALKPSEGQAPIEPWSMDKSADRLMDDVFADVDMMIDSGGEPPVETPQEEYVSLQQMSIPSINIPPGTVSRPVQVPPTIDAEKSQKPDEQGRSLNKMLLGAACASLAFILLLWLAGQGRLNSLFGMKTASVPEAQKVPTEADNQFIDYMQRSIDIIGQKSSEKDNREVAVLPPPPIANNLVPVPAPGNLPQNPNRPQSVLERVYIPVFPRPQIVYGNPPAPPAANPSPTVAAAAPNTNTAKPSPTVAASARPTAKPAPTAVASARPTAKPAPTAVASARPTTTPSATVAASPRPSAKPSPTAAATARATATPSATVGAAPRPSAATSPRVTAPSSPSPVAASPLPVPQPTFRPQPTTTQAAASTPAIRHTLVGVLSLGDKSAAIFEVNGASRRIYVGESIASSGWTLVEVKNDEALIRRNGEVRSIYVGQQF